MKSAKKKVALSDLFYMAKLNVSNTVSKYPIN